MHVNRRKLTLEVRGGDLMSTVRKVVFFATLAATAVLASGCTYGIWTVELTP